MHECAVLHWLQPAAHRLPLYVTIGMLRLHHPCCYPCRQQLQPAAHTLTVSATKGSGTASHCTPQRYQRYLTSSTLYTEVTLCCTTPAAAVVQVNPQLDGRIVACQLTPTSLACASSATAASAGVVHTSSNPVGSIVPYVMQPMQEQVQCSR